MPRSWKRRVSTGGTSLFMRAEIVHVETSLLLADTVASEDDDERKDPVGALTVGAMRDVLTWGGFQGGLGASVTGYTVPSALTGTHGFRPVSYPGVLPPAPAAELDGTDVEHAHGPADEAGHRPTCRSRHELNQRSRGRVKW